MQPDVERAVAQLAASQYGAIARSQALELGMSASVLRTKLARGEWRVADRGIYEVTGSSPCWQRDAMVAVLGAGPAAVASGETAGLIHGVLRDVPSVIDVTVPWDKHPRQSPRRRTHRTRALRRSDVSRVGRIPVTSTARTLLDLAGILTDERLEAALDAALMSRRTSIAAMRRYLKVCGRTRNVARLTRLLDDREFGIPESELERVFERLIKHERLPVPVRQRPVSRFRVDYAYVELNIVIEVDGSATRSTKAQLQRDRRRQNEIVLEQHLIVRFTWDDVTKDGPYVVETIRRAIDARAGGGS
jgi:very-short-patch-repair endonuclease